MIIFYISVTTEDIEDVIIMKTMPTSRNFQSTGMFKNPKIVPFCTIAKFSVGWYGSRQGGES